jgi:glycosyltransferase involved in cell wall biosynthesis
MGKLISIVIPCYNEEKTINIICEAIQKTMEQVDDMEYELLLVNDGSSDDTLEKMQKLAEKNTRIKYYSFSRNFGKEAAIYAGLCNAKGDYVVTFVLLFNLWLFRNSTYLPCIFVFFTFAWLLHYEPQTTFFAYKVKNWSAGTCFETFDCFHQHLC